jgi:cytochrome c oxidase subunit 4
MTTQHDTHGGEETHQVSYGHYILIWLGLLALTGVTVAFAGVSLGRWVIITALTIASIKSLLVLNVFMHLRFEQPMFRIFAFVAGITFAIFISLTFFDYAFH